MMSPEQAEIVSPDTTVDAAAAAEKNLLQEEEEKFNITSSDHQSTPESPDNSSTTDAVDADTTRKNRYHQLLVVKSFYATPTSRKNDNSSNNHHTDTQEDEWEHIFLDLFYVPAIGNLSEVLASVIEPEVVDVTKEDDGMESWYSTYSYIGGSGFLCFFAVFFAIWTSWYHQCVYDCKFVARDSFHRYVNRVRLIFVAIAIYHISEYEQFVGVENEKSFYFCLGITVECVISLLLRIETIIMTSDDDDGSVRKDSIMTIGFQFFPRLAFYVAAWITQKHSEQWPWLLLCGTLVPTIFIMLVEHFFTSSAIPMSHREYFPRIGSWVSIVIGEGIIALLKPDSNRMEEELISAILGISTLTVLHSIYFYKDGQINASIKFRGRLQTALIELLSIAFVGIGVSSKQGTAIQNALSEDTLLWKNGTGYDATIEPGDLSDGYYVYTESQLVVVDEAIDLHRYADWEKTAPWYPKISRWYVNRTYFICLPSVLFFLEVIFWTSNPTYVAKVRRLFQQEHGMGTKLLVASGFILQLASLLTVAITGSVNDGMLSLAPVYRHLIGLVMSSMFLLSRTVAVAVFLR